MGIGLGLGSAGVFATAIFLPVAAPVLIGATVASITTGAFSTTVSSMALSDRSKHQQVSRYFNGKYAVIDFFFYIEF